MSRNRISPLTAICWHLSLWAVALVLSQASPGAASANARDHGAHVHGVGQLNVAVEGKTVELEFISPGTDIVGFEHAAESAEDKAAVEDAVTTLKDGDALFTFPPEAGCRLEEAEVESALIDEGHDDQKGREHGGKEAGRENEEHAEFHAHYHFRCDHPDRLTHVDVRVFEHFPAARELDVQMISSRGQSAKKLTPTSARLSF